MKHNRKIIFLAGFLFSIPVALVSYINSSYLETYIDKNYVGIIYIVASTVAILGLLKMPKALNIFGNRLTILLSFLLTFSSLILLATTSNILVAIPAFVVYFASISFIIFSLDIFIEDFSKDSSVGSLRGLYLTIINIAWIISQIISGSVINNTSLSKIYLISAGFIFVGMLIFVFFLRNFKDPEYKKISVLKTLKSFIENKNISKIYLSSLILQFFYAWMIIYTPIYLHEYMNFSWDKIGVIFSIMLIPFILLDYPLGKLSDKIGEKKMLNIGFIIIFISVFCIPFLKESSVLIWAMILFMTRVGAATIEIMNEAYFFKNVKEENADEISFYRNASPFAYIIAPLLAVPILFLIPSFKYLFFVLSAILLSGFFISLRIKDVK
ncbi:MAG: MFS transporter [Burkholderiales bacterium]|nr:MFS transporter [Burkholderiales bacterium]